MKEQLRLFLEDTPSMDLLKLKLEEAKKRCVTYNYSEAGDTLEKLDEFIDVA
jgi:hypothetical protein